MAIINDYVMESLNDAIASGDTELYNEIKKANWIVDLYEYEEAKNEAISNLNFID